MNRDRLLRLRNLMLSHDAARRNFNMNHWVANVDGLDLAPGLGGRVVDPVITHRCQTAACAAGYAAMSPEFMAEGLRLSFVPEHGGPLDRALYDPLEHGLNIRVHSFYRSYPVYENYVGIYALRKFFDLTSDQAKYLFMPESYVDPEDDIPPPVSPLDVVHHIDCLLYGSYV